MAAHFALAAKASGKSTQLKSRPPRSVAFLWEWFLELHAMRGSSGDGPEPISPSDIAAWAQLEGKPLTPWMTRAIREMDQVFMRAYAEQARKRLSKHARKP